HLGLTALRLRDMLDLAYHGISWRSRQSPLSGSATRWRPSARVPRTFTTKSVTRSTWHRSAKSTQTRSRSRDSALACWKSSPTIVAIRIEPCTRCGSPSAYTFFTSSRRSRRKASRHQNQKSSWCDSGSSGLRSWTRSGSTENGHEEGLRRRKRQRLRGSRICTARGSGGEGGIGAQDYEDHRAPKIHAG